MRRLICAALLGLGLLGGVASEAPARAAMPGPGLTATSALLVPVQYRRRYYAPPPRVYRPRYAPPRYARPSPPRARYAPPPRRYYRR